MIKSPTITLKALGYKIERLTPRFGVYSNPITHENILIEQMSKGLFNIYILAEGQTVLNVSVTDFHLHINSVY